MAIIDRNAWNTRNIYFFYDFEDYYMRYEHESRKIFLKSKSKGEEYERPHNNRLVCDIERFGDEITKEQYDNMSCVAL